MSHVHNSASEYGGYGWIPQHPDLNDFEFLPTVAAQSIPQQFQLDISGIPVLDQGQQGSCTGHGTSGIVMFDQKKQGLPIVVPAREFIYYNARVYEGSQDSDSGALVRDAVKVVAKLGVPSDSDFPYNDQVFNVKPPDQAYTDAIKQEATVYEAVRYPHLNQAVASGYPFVFGFTVYESFESGTVASNGVVPIPEKGESVLGGHCVWCYGYNSAYSNWSAPDGSIYPARSKKCRNSWNEGWGYRGDFYLPQWYFDNQQCSDYWVIRQLTAAA